MKIIRYIDLLGRIGHAAQQIDGSALAIEGDIFGGHEVTDRRVEIARRGNPVRHEPRG